MSQMVNNARQFSCKTEECFWHLY